MKKRLYFLVSLMLCNCMMVAAGVVISGIRPPQSGMAVWGNALCIHSSDTLLAQGNLYLFDADVSGEGTLLLSDTVSRHIVAHNSSLPYLIIHNTDTVALHGDLYIRAGLTLAQGVFDTRAGRLELADTAFVHILPGGFWLQTDPVATHYVPIFPLLPPKPQQLLLVADFPPSIHTVPARLGHPHTKKIPLFTATPPTQVWLRIPHPPPKTGVGEPVASYTLPLLSACLHRCS